jgi:hypothetical protein
MGVRISDLTDPLVTAADADIVVVVDDDASQTKYVTLSNFWDNYLKGKVEAETFTILYTDEISDATTLTFDINGENQLALTDGAFAPAQADVNLGATGDGNGFARLFMDAGSAAAPAIVFDEDTDAGLYLVGAGEIGVSIGGTGQLKFTDGSITPITDNDIDLGDGTYGFGKGYFNDVYLNGTSLSATLLSLTASGATDMEDLAKVYLMPLQTSHLVAAGPVAAALSGICPSHMTDVNVSGWEASENHPLISHPSYGAFGGSIATASVTSYSDTGVYTVPRTYIVQEESTSTGNFANVYYTMYQFPASAKNNYANLYDNNSLTVTTGTKTNPVTGAVNDIFTAAVTTSATIYEIALGSSYSCDTIGAMIGVNVDGIGTGWSVRLDYKNGTWQTGSAQTGTSAASGTVWFFVPAHTSVTASDIRVVAERTSGSDTVTVCVMQLFAWEA